ncbi:MAG: hypothetical protein PHD61_10235 [Bacteroidales bacterium]|nr:hypothetical protein [Lentimicrobiaceae bacterium]MDD5695663.1 hypothetical protein [Bacteroidales bacterium]
MKNLVLPFVVGSYVSFFHTSYLMAQLREFGDAPEGVLAYPATGLTGWFPTCKALGPAGWVEHDNWGAVLGPAFEFDGEGNGGLCPQFNPYDNDECKGDGDAGLIIPGAFTIVGGVEVACVPGDVAPLGPAGSLAAWGANVDITLTNSMPSSSPGYMNVIIDWAQDGSWGGGTEHILVDWYLPNGYSGPLSGLGPPNFVIGPNSGYVWARFTISEQQVGQGWDGTGSFEDGESEDYLSLVALSSGNLDFGDAPDGPYPTLLASNGARHTNNGIVYIGALIDSEVDGQPTANADGGDLANVDDEDGVIFTSPLIRGQMATLQITVPISCQLNAWMDFNQFNGWADLGEQIFLNQQLVAGSNALSFQVPATASLGPTCSRWRVDMIGGLSYDVILMTILYLGFAAGVSAQTWSTPDAGVTVYKTLTNGNVGIGTVTPSYKLHVFNGTSSCDVIAESNIAGPSGPIGRLRLLNTSGGDIFNIAMRKTGGVTEMLQSAYDASTSTWREFIYFNYATQVYEIRWGIGTVKYLNNGNVLFSNTGNVGIGEINPSSKLAVNGSITCKEVEVKETGWSDFVFDDDYILPSLSELDQYVQQHRRLPGVPSAREVRENGVKLGQMDAILLQKIEELTLYLIELQKENEALKARISALEN